MLFSSVLTAATSSVMQAELDSCRELLQLEPENKCETFMMSSLQSSHEASYSGTPLKDTPEIRTLLYYGHIAMSKICFLNVNLPLKRGHLSIQDTLPGPQGVHNSGAPL